MLRALGRGRAQRGKPLFHIGLRLGDVPARRADALDGKALLLPVRRRSSARAWRSVRAYFCAAARTGSGKRSRRSLLADGGLGLAELLRGLLLREVIAADEPGKGVGLLPVVEVAALEIFDEREQSRVLLPHPRNQARHLAQPGQPRRAQTTLPAMSSKSPPARRTVSGWRMP